MSRKALLKRTNTVGRQPLLDTQDSERGIGLGELAINYESSDVALYTVKEGEQDGRMVCNVMYESHPCKFLSPVSEHSNSIIVDETKRWQVFRFDTEPNPENEWEITLPTSSSMYWGKEIHSIIENNTASVMKVTIPLSYKSFDGYELYIDAGCMGEVSIAYDGTDCYVRMTGNGSPETYTVQSEIDRGVYRVRKNITPVGEASTSGYTVLDVQCTPED